MKHTNDPLNHWYFKERSEAYQKELQAEKTAKFLNLAAQDAIRQQNNDLFLNLLKQAE